MSRASSARKAAHRLGLMAAHWLLAGVGHTQTAAESVGAPPPAEDRASAPAVPLAASPETEPPPAEAPLPQTPPEEPSADDGAGLGMHSADTKGSPPPLSEAPPLSEVPPLAESLPLVPAPPQGDPPLTKAKKKKKKTKVALGARIYAGWEYDRERPRGTQTGDSDTDQRFFLRQARVSLRGKHQDWLTLRLNAELADALDPAFRSSSTRGEDIDYLRTAYVNLRAREELQLRVGRFRRPFSGLELTSSFDLPIRSRGLTNGFIVEAGDSSLYWGDRAVGAMIWGRTQDKTLRWALSFSNPRVEEQGVMANVRLEYRPLPWLRLATNAATRRAENLSGERLTAFAAGGDVRVRHAGLEILVDAIAGQNVDSIANDKPFAAGILGYVSYDIRAHRGLTLRPVLALEWLDRTLDTSQSEAGRAVLGLNWVLDKRFRLLTEVDLRRPLGQATNLNPILARERYSLLALTEF